MVEPVTTEPVTITFAYPETPDHARYSPFVEAFQAEYPHIEVAIKPSPTMQLARDPESGVDAFVWWPEPEMAAEGAVSAIDEHLSQAASFQV